MHERTLATPAASHARIRIRHGMNTIRRTGGTRTAVWGGPVDRPAAAAAAAAATILRRRPRGRGECMDFSALAARTSGCAWSPHRRPEAGARAGADAQCSVDGRYGTGAACLRIRRRVVVQRALHYASRLSRSWSTCAVRRRAWPEGDAARTRDATPAGREVACSCAARGRLRAVRSCCCGRHRPGRSARRT